MQNLQSFIGLASLFWHSIFARVLRSEFFCKFRYEEARKHSVAEDAKSSEFHRSCPFFWHSILARVSRSEFFANSATKRAKLSVAEDAKSSDFQGGDFALQSSTLPSSNRFETRVARTKICPRFSWRFKFFRKCHEISFLFSTCLRNGANFSNIFAPSSGSTM